MALRWYIVHAYSNFEHRVKAALEERIERMGLQDKFGEILVPTEEVVEMREGQKRRSERKFFPGYMLVQMSMTESAWYLVKSTPKITGFVGNSTKPQPVPEHEIRQITNQIAEGAERVTPKVMFEKGDSVRVESPVGKIVVPLKISEHIDNDAVFIPRNFSSTPVTSLLMRKKRVDRVKISKVAD